mgnify:CR=1 FL=1
MELDVYKVDVFTTTPLKGNPAAVVLGMLDEETMLALASELNLSETVFVKKEGNAFRLRYFTPTSEVPICGHATIAAFHVLKLKGIAEGSCTAITNAGVVEVQVEDKIWIRMPKPKLASRTTMDFPSPSSTLPVVDVGLKIGIVEVASFRELMELKPTPELADYCINGGVDGVYAFTFDSRCDAATRFFAPALGVEEDPVTGTAGAALAYYLHTDRLVKEEYTFEQGHAMRRVGTIYAKIGREKCVWVGGNAVCVLEGKIRI